MAAQAGDSLKLSSPLVRDPIVVYNDWSAYDELSDNIPLTEQLAMKELDEILRLRKFGVRFDYYMMDAFWFDPDGGYRTWRKPNWPNGPEAWIKSCRENGILPGLWFGTNALVKLNPASAWQDSLTEKKGSMSFTDGGFLPTLMDTLQYWYDHGIRMFEFDFADFDAATPATAKIKSREEIRIQRIRRRPGIDRRSFSISQCDRSALARGVRYALCGRSARFGCASLHKSGKRREWRTKCGGVSSAAWVSGY